jgi:hypothetical protein
MAETGTTAFDERLAGVALLASTHACSRVRNNRATNSAYINGRALFGLMGSYL